MYQFDPDVSYESAFYVDTAMKVLLNSGYFIGLAMLKKCRLNPKLIFLIGGCMAVCGVVASSFTKSQLAFVSFYGSMYGLGGGICFMLPI